MRVIKAIYTLSVAHRLACIRISVCVCHSPPLNGEALDWNENLLTYRPKRAARPWLHWHPELMILSWRAGGRVWNCRMFSSVPRLHPLGASNISSKCLQALSPPGTKSPLVDSSWIKVPGHRSSAHLGSAASQPGASSRVLHLLASVSWPVK